MNKFSEIRFKDTNTQPILLGKPIAILVDGAFFLKRYNRCFKHGYQDDAEVVVKNMYTMLLKHVENEQLYRILFYDCPPLQKKFHNPITGKLEDYSKSNVANFRTKLHAELIKKRKVALRLGILKEQRGWQIHKKQLKKVLKKEITIGDLNENDVYYDIIQKGVDMKIGLDIASLAYKKLVSRIILVTGDSDFVPAAKLARREGIDVVLDPMWQNIDEELFEHIDGLKSTWDKPWNINQ